MGSYIQYLLIRCVIFVLSFLPVSFLIECAHGVGNVLFLLMGRRRKIALENIDKAFGDSCSESSKRDLARAAFQSMSVSLAELFLVEKIKRNIDKHFTLVGNEHLKEAFDQGRGVVLVISHLGSWEFLSFLPYITGQNWSVIVKNVKNPYLNYYIKHLRSITTTVPVEKTTALRPILKELKKNHGVAILIDQWAGGEGLWLDFFGVKASTTSMPVRLAKKTGCIMIPAYCIRQSSGKYEIQIHPPVAFDANDKNWEQKTTEKLNGLLEDQIRKYPEQWLWAHRRWKEKPSQLRETSA